MKRWQFLGGLILFLGRLWMPLDAWAQVRPGQDPFANPNSFGEFGNSQFGTENDTATNNVGEEGQLLLEPNPEEIYGPTTTTYIFETDLLRNNIVSRYVDTTLNYFHRYNYVARKRFTYQDLGNLGTATQSMYYQVPDRLGFRMGLHALDPYITHPDEVRYYDTKSPFSRWYYVQGSSGRSLVDIIFSQNIKPNWNATIRHKRINARLLVGTEPANNNDRQVSHETWMASTRFRSNNGNYNLLFSVNHFSHFMGETGGLLLTPNDSSLLDSYVPESPDELPPSDLESIDELFTLGTGELTNIFTSLAGAVPESDRKRTQVRLVHQYTLAGKEALQLYHILHRSTESYRYFDPSFSTHAGAYPNTLLYSSGSTMEHTINFNEFENQAGLKGLADKLFYTVYLGRRDYAYRFSFFPGENVPRRLRAQNYFGFKGEYRLTPKIYFNGNFEQIVGARGGTRLNVTLNTPYVSANHKRIVAQPDLMQEFYYGNIFQWNHLPESAAPFQNLDYSLTEAKASLPLGNLQINPFARFNTFRNYTYYNTEALPEQFGDAINVLMIGTEINHRVGVLHQQFYGIYARSGETSVLRMPELLCNYNVFVEVNFPGKTMLSRFGIDLHWHSEFFADAYMPVTQQFFLQNDLQLGNYLQAEVYWTFNLKKVNMFLKMTNAAQGLMGDGYFLTPLYMAQPRAFEFGVNWLFYD